jgi:hypothetical protein
MRGCPKGRLEADRYASLPLDHYLAETQDLFKRPQTFLAVRTFAKAKVGC